ncbi:MAG: hypothetical protein IIC63_05410, partial [Proteobacteria bacterium]|nr:hypothetical protein [Pseudomonadota bacterium]
MNFLAHLLLAGDDDGLRLGALLGDFVRGRRALVFYPGDVRLGIKLHRHTDQFFDSMPEVVKLRKNFPASFRRYSGIVIDLAYDHEHFATVYSGNPDFVKLAEAYGAKWPVDMMDKADALPTSPQAQQRQK